MPESRLGPYLLRTPLGRGGMGEVWDAVHVPSGSRVAVKVLNGRGPKLVEALRNELRAVAALDHPHVVAPLDGGVGEDGAPWLVMEHVDGRTLSRVGRLPWSGVRIVLLALLDALAHAHARGVVHRDLKPANVMIDRRGSVRLLDFGLARLQAGSAAPADGLSGGTPSFTAPEQFTGRLDEQGPWTDLYALGCVAYRLVCGGGPYPRRGWAEAMRAHLEAPIPELTPIVGVPDGLDAWVRRLLAKDPADRFRRAADAAWALLRLPPPDGAGPLPGGEEEDLEEGEGTTLAWMPSEQPRPAPVPSVVERPPIPRDWRRPRRALRLLPGAGLGLYGLRAIPVVGRAAQQDRLWSLLHEVDATGRPRAVVVHGPTGVGKTRLAEWLGRRAHEVGAAEVLRVVHDPAMGPSCGLAAAIRRHLGVHARSEADLARRLAGWGDLGRSLADLLLDRLATEDERQGVLRGVLGAMAGERPVLVHLDDAPYDPAAGPFVEGVVRAGREPILFVLTASDPLLAEAPLPASFDALALGPLDPAGRRSLVRELLGLDGELAAEVEARTGGNPLFAVQLVGDWVARGVLVPSAGGFRLADGATAELPSSLRELGAQALARVLPEDERSVELAAVLGLEVDGREWLAACAAAGVSRSTAAAEALVEARLARTGPDGPSAGFAFAHGMVREVLLERCRRAHRFVAANHACADAVADPLRRGLHLVAAGDDAAALSPLLEGADRSVGHDDYRRATVPLQQREEAMARLGLPPQDERWGEGRIHRVRILRLRGEWTAAEQEARALVADADRYGWPVGARARIELAHVLRGRGRATEALDVIDAAEPAVRDQPLLLAMLRIRRTLALLDLGQLDEAQATGEAALAFYDTAGLGVMAGHARIVLAMCLQQAGRLDEAEACLLRAREDYVAGRTAAGVANAWNNLGELRRFRGDLLGAEEAYRASVAAYDALASGHATLPRVNLAVVRLLRGDAAGALPVLDEGCDVLARQGRRSLLAVVEVARMLAHALLADGPAFDASAARAAELLSSSRVVEADVRTFAARAAEAWARDPARAAVALRLAGVAAIESQR